MAMQGNLLPLSVVPSLTLPLDENMNFLERAENFMYHILAELIFYWVRVPFFQKHIQRHFPDSPNYFTLYINRSLTLINGNFVLDTNIPLLRNQVEIGTITAKEPMPLPEDIEEFVNGSGEDGVIYLSLGSIAKCIYIPENYKKLLLSAFKKIPQRVLWKYEGDDLELPPNVMVKKWFPQQDVLGHQKTKIFMPHCGNLGAQEAKYYGVPILAVQVTFDQPRNAARLAKKGLGIIVNWKDMTEEKLINAINTLINDSSYSHRMKMISRALKDRRETSRELAVWWIEYAVRHHGEPQLLYAGNRLNFFQYFMGDVVLFWISLFGILLFLSYLVLKTFSKLIKRSNTKTTKEKIS